MKLLLFVCEVGIALVFIHLMIGFQPNAPVDLGGYARYIGIVVGFVASIAGFRHYSARLLRRS